MCISMCCRFKTIYEMVYYTKPPKQCNLLVFCERPLYSFGYDPYEKNCSNRADLLKFACRAPLQYADFLKSATGQLPTCACRNPPPPSLQIFWNLPLDSYLSYLHVLAESPPSLQIFWNLPLDSYLHYLHVLAEFPPPQFADFLESATGQLPKLPTCACRNSPSPVFGDFPKICHWTVT